MILKYEEFQILHMVYQTSNSLVNDREFLILEEKKCSKEGSHMILRFSIEAEKLQPSIDISPNPNFVLGQMLESGCILIPSSNSEETCELIILNQVDLKG